MAGDDYTSTPSTGKLKLKGVSDGRIDKKKKKKRPKPDAESTNQESTLQPSDTATAEPPQDNPDVNRTLADEDAQITNDSRREVSLVDGHAISPATAAQAGDPADARDQLRTDAERRFEEQRRKRLEERLKREGVKTHKQRVEELNKYLSGLSEHHDMPKIGPG